MMNEARPVERRIGGLEKFKQYIAIKSLVERRIGGLEIRLLNILSIIHVERRIGGLENTVQVA